MSVLKSVLIEDKEQQKEMRFFPDPHLCYWDVSVREKTGVYWYYQIHFSSVMGFIYRAGRDGLSVKLSYAVDGGENKDVEL